MPADFSLLQTPNLAQAALGGYQAGQAVGRQKRLDAALQGVDLERPETIYAVLHADPTTGAALLGTSMKMAEYKHELASKAATSDYLLKRMGLDGGSGASASPTTPVPQQAGAQAVDGAANSTLATGSPTDANGDIVVTAPHANPEAARIAMIRNDPEGYIKLETHLAGMDEAKQKAISGITSTFDAALQGVKALPYAQRASYLASHRDALIQAGVPAQQIDGFDPTDENITAVDNQVLGIKGIIERQDKDRNYALQKDKFAHDVAHDATTEGIAAGHLAIAQHADARAASSANKPKASSASSAGGGAAFPSPTSRAAFNALPSGTRFRAPDGSIRVKP